MIVGADGLSRTKISHLPLRWQPTGRLSVDVEGDPPVDHKSYRFKLHKNFIAACASESGFTGSHSGVNEFGGSNDGLVPI